jgi:hypothetical protein
VRSVSNCGALVTKASKELLAHWDFTSSKWRDSARADFEKAYIDELMLSARSAAGAMDTVTAVLRKALQQCR